MTLPGPQALTADFNAAVDTHRLLMLVSPTCADCHAGVRMATDALSVFPRAPVSVHILWLLMLPDDSVTAATAMAEDIPDRRVRHYWEGEGWPVSAAVRPVLNLGPLDTAYSAWDVYLWYLPGAKWMSHPPRPKAWAFNFPGDPPAGGVRADQSVFERWMSSTAAPGHEA